MATIDKAVKYNSDTGYEKLNCSENAVLRDQQHSYKSNGQQDTVVVKIENFISITFQLFHTLEGYFTKQDFKVVWLKGLHIQLLQCGSDYLKPDKWSG